MKNTDVIIIGAGAAGLMAAYTLVKAGRTVTVLEARHRIGGRIHTITNNGFSGPVELGAEFVHGDLPVTLGLLKEAGIAYHDVSFEMWQQHNGKFEQSEEFVEGWAEFLEKVNQLREDMPIHDYLQQNFSGEEHAKMRRQIENYVAGYDTADIHDAGTFALRNEWNYEDEDAQHRLINGYSAMIDYIADACRNTGSSILLNIIVKEVLYEEDVIKVTAASGEMYEAEKIIIALPLGVLQAGNNTEGAITFNPPLPEQAKAIKGIGFGSVIKILLEFDAPFWENYANGGLSTMGFLFSDTAIPTFWTQAPTHSPLLTGWLGGLPAYEQAKATREDILYLTLTSLSTIFGIDFTILKNRLAAWEVVNWTADPFTRGSYAYDKVESANARKIVQQPVENKLYFAGEYLYDGPAMGTVEAALTSGLHAAKMLLQN